MTVLRALVGGRDRRSAENPNRPLTDATLIDVLGGGSTSTAGVTVSEESALGLLAFYRAVALISSTAASLPLKTFRRGSRQRLYPLVLDQPHPDLEPFEFWETVYVHLLTWGNAYVRKLRDARGVVQSLRIIEPWRVKDPEIVDPSDSNPGGKVFPVHDARTGTYTPFTTYEILHIPGLGYDGRKGVPPVRLARQALGTAMAAEQFAGQFFGNGSHLSGVLASDKPIQEAEAEKLKARWRAKHSGVGNAHDVAVLGSGLKFQPVSIPPEDAELLATRRFSVSEIARLFGVPPHMLGDVEGSTSWGTGIEQQTIGFVVFTLRPWLTRVEQRASRHLLPPQWYCEFAVEGLLRGDSAARAAFYGQGIKDGWMVRNEARGFENLEPLDGLDVPLMPLNMAAVGTGDNVADTKTRVDAAAILVRAGYKPDDALTAVGLDPIGHLGLLPVTLKGPADPAATTDPEDLDA